MGKRFIFDDHVGNFTAKKQSETILSLSNEKQKNKSLYLTNLRINHITI